MARTWEELYEQAEQDHNRCRGRVVRVRTVGVSNDADTSERDFPTPIPVTIEDMPLSWSLDTQEFTREELLDVYYSADGAVPDQPDEHVWWVYGPTYHLDGCVEYPEWWSSVFDKTPNEDAR